MKVELIKPGRMPTPSTTLDSREMKLPKNVKGKTAIRDYLREHNKMDIKPGQELRVSGEDVGATFRFKADEIDTSKHWLFR